MLLLHPACVLVRCPVAFSSSAVSRPAFSRPMSGSLFRGRSSQGRINRHICKGTKNLHILCTRACINCKEAAFCTPFPLFLRPFAASQPIPRHAAAWESWRQSVRATALRCVFRRSAPFAGAPRPQAAKAFPRRRKGLGIATRRPSQTENDCVRFPFRTQSIRQTNAVVLSAG